jgi:hypothetical protein
VVLERDGIFVREIHTASIGSGFRISKQIRLSQDPSPTGT